MTVVTDSRKAEILTAEVKHLDKLAEKRAADVKRRAKARGY